MNDVDIFIKSTGRTFSVEYILNLHLSTFIKVLQGADTENLIKVWSFLILKENMTQRVLHVEDLIGPYEMKKLKEFPNE